MTEEIDFLALERELPSLAGLKRFAEGLQNVAWFSHMGEALDDKTRAQALSYLDHLGFPDANIAQLVDWEDAGLAAETLDWATQAWEAEELARADLTLRALDYMSDEALQVGMTMIAEQAGDVIKEAMQEAASLWDIVHEDLQNLAVGSAVQAAHHAGLALVIAANEPDFEMSTHMFGSKYALYESGRWPVSVTGTSFNLF
jgi:hypothetical protein